LLLECSQRRWHPRLPGSNLSVDAGPARNGVALPLLHHETLQFLVDSGENEIILFNRSGETRQISQRRSATLRGMNRNRACFAERTTTVLGGTVLPEMNVVECLGLTRNQADSDGLIPTKMFRRVL